MSSLRYARRRDLSEPAIIEALERVGAEVWPLDYPVDLLVLFRRSWFLLECKTGRGKSITIAKDPRQQAQQNFIATTGTPVVCTPVEALKAIGAPIGETA